MRALRLAVSALGLTLSSTQLAQAQPVPTSSASIAQSTPGYPFYNAGGNLVIRDHKINDKRPVHDNKLDYSQHGKNWEAACSSEQDEQSPLNLSWETAEANDLIQFDMIYIHKLSNATVKVDAEGSVIRLDYPNKLDNDLRVYNERREDQLYHLSHMYWHTPSEHTINDRQMAAELQIFHIQYATNRQVAISILFDKDLALGMEEMKLKTCFFQAFDFKGTQTGIDAGEKPSIIDVPLKEFIDFIPQDKYVYYSGSQTKPSCEESVTWIVNMQPYVITEEQVGELKSLLASDVQSEGNYRNIQALNERTIYKFSNVGNLLASSGALSFSSFALVAPLFGLLSI